MVLGYLRMIWSVSGKQENRPMNQIPSFEVIEMGQNRYPDVPRDAGNGVNSSPDASPSDSSTVLNIVRATIGGRIWHCSGVILLQIGVWLYREI